MKYPSLVTVTKLLTTLSTLLTLAACGEPIEQADFRFISPSAHHHLDPQKISWSHDIRIIECLFEPLVKLHPTNPQPQPAVANQWHISNDRLTYTFKLRPDARWSNGDPVTAQDFIYAWQRAMLPDLAADYTQLLFCIKGAQAFFHWRNQQLTQFAQNDSTTQTQTAQQLWDKTQKHFTETVGLAAPNDQTLVVQLAQPTPYFLQLCAFATLMPVHRNSLEKLTSIHTQTGMLVQDPSWTKPQNLISNGPYTLKQWKFKRHLLLTANDHYWDRQSMQNNSILELIVEKPTNRITQIPQRGNRLATRHPHRKPNSCRSDQDQPTRRPHITRCRHLLLQLQLQTHTQQHNPQPTSRPTRQTSVSP